jgi:hypothetical protein
MDDFGVGGGHGGAGFVPTTALMLELRQRQLVATGAKLAALESHMSGAAGLAVPRDSHHSGYPCVDFDAIDNMWVSCGCYCRCCC